MWKLSCENGRQVWNYLKGEPRNSALSLPFDSKTQPNSSDLVYRSSKLGYIFPLPSSDETRSLPLLSSSKLSLLKAIDFYQQLQDEDGHWPGDYGGPMFLLPGLIIACYASSTILENSHKEEILRYIFNHQNEDGGWGLHIESSSTMFGSALNYCAARVLGASSLDPRIEKGREYIKRNGGAIGIPAWGKFWLAVLGTYDWKGMNTLLPELWLLPAWTPFHPSRFWCHCRMVYLVMSYVYAHRIVAPHTSLTEELRKEIYVEDYEKIDWQKARETCASTDSFTPRSRIVSFLNKYFLNLYEDYHLPLLRSWSSSFVMDQVHSEDEATNYIDIGPVSKVTNLLAVWHSKGQNSKEYLAHVERLKDYLWISEDGMKVQGYNGSQLWDLVFTVQAILEGYESSTEAMKDANSVPRRYCDTLRKAYRFLERSQILEDVPERKQFFRHNSKGGWPFSTKDHSWPISDCTAEGITTTLLFHSISGLIQEDDREEGANEGQVREGQFTITYERLCDAVELVLSLQNKDGGWGTYENTRVSTQYIEILNTSDVFGNIMLDYSFTECTSASIRALVNFRRKYPHYRRPVLSTAIDRGVEFLTKQQEEDGSWYGSWAVCFTYGTWFGIEGLIAAGVPNSHPSIQRACEFLLMHQNPDGGWGESSQSCSQRKWIPHEQSQVVHTSWALLSLMIAKVGNQNIEKGIRFLLERQQSDGDWPQEGITGVFSSNCMITYTSYRNVFPIWALNRYQHYVKSN